MSDPIVRLPHRGVVVLVGPSGSGKTRWADENFRAGQVVSSDRLRAMVGEGEHDIEKTKTGPQTAGAVQSEGEGGERIWRECVAACEAMADEFVEVIEKDQLGARLQPLW